MPATAHGMWLLSGAGFRCFPGGIDWQVAYRGALPHSRQGAAWAFDFNVPRGTSCM